MYPSRFRYEAPRTLDEAVGLLRDGAGEAKVLAGGQSLIPLLKLRFAAPELLVDINGLPDLGHLTVDPDGTIRVGALCRHADLERSQQLAATQPTMAAAAPLIADPIVRNRGTLVGSLCHADPQGDWAAAVTAVGGHVVAVGAGGRREIDFRDFVTGPFQNTLGFDEVAVEAVVRPPRGRIEGGFLKLERRVGDFATAGVAVSVDFVGDRIEHLGIALTGVGPRTLYVAAADDELRGSTLDTAAVTRAADLAAETAQPSADHRGSAEYKRHVIHTFVRRILTRIADSSERAA